MKAAMLYRYGWLLLSCLTGLAHAGAITITAEYNPANYVKTGRYLSIPPLVPRRR